MEGDSMKKLTGQSRDIFIRLQRVLEKYDSLVVAYSGGTDSTLLAYVASRVLPGRVEAFSADTSYMLRDELTLAKDFCRKYRIPHKTIQIPFPEEIRLNPPDRCYLCKLNLFTKMKEYALNEGFTVLADGSHADDLKDYRPGRKALHELGIKSPLQEAGLTKKEIRILAKELGLANWNLPSNACLLTRLEHNKRVDENLLPRIEEGEKLVRSKGFSQVRLRYYGSFITIETDPAELHKLRDEALRTEILNGLKELGFPKATIDAEGYRSGKMNIKK